MSRRTISLVGNNPPVLRRDQLLPDEQLQAWIKDKEAEYNRLEFERWYGTEKYDKKSNSYEEPIVVDTRPKNKVQQSIDIINSEMGYNNPEDEFGLCCHPEWVERARGDVETHLRKTCPYLFEECNEEDYDEFEREVLGKGRRR